MNSLIIGNVEKLLCFFVVEYFMIGFVFFIFINEMFFLECWRDESDCVIVLNDLVEVFFVLIKRFGEVIVYRLLFL